jgi:hypothetical protein
MFVFVAYAKLNVAIENKINPQQNSLSNKLITYAW